MNNTDTFTVKHIDKRLINPISESLSKIDWKIFGCLTFDNNKFTHDLKFSEDLRKKEFLNLMNGIRGEFRLRGRDLMFYGKSEFGVAKRGHYHFLVGESGLETIQASKLASRMAAMWTDKNHYRGEQVKIEPFRHDLAHEGVIYQSKLEYDSQGEPMSPNEIISPKLKREIIKQNTSFN
jgi:hypothetical protein